MSCLAGDDPQQDKFSLSPAAYFGIKPDGDLLQARLRFTSNLDENLNDAARTLRDGDYGVALATFNQIRWVEERRNDRAGFAKAVVFEVQALTQSGHLVDAIRIADELFDSEQFEAVVSPEYAKTFGIVGDELDRRGLFEDLDIWLGKFDDPDRIRSPFHWFHESHPSQAFLAQYPKALWTYRSRLTQAHTAGNPLPAQVVDLAIGERFPVPRPSKLRLCCSAIAILIGLTITIGFVQKVSWNHRSARTLWGHSNSVFNEMEADFLPIPGVADPLLRALLRRYTSIGVFLLAALAFTLPLAGASWSEGTFWPIPEIRQTYLRAFGDRISFLVLGPLIVVLACRLCTAIGRAYMRLKNEFGVDQSSIAEEIKRFRSPAGGWAGLPVAYLPSYSCV